MIVIESTGRKAKDAIEKGLAELGKTLREVDVEIIDNGGLFRKAKVRITVLGDEPAPEPKKPEVEARPVKKEAPKANENREVRKTNENREAREEKREERRSYEEKKESQAKNNKPRKEERPHKPDERKEAAPKQEAREERQERHYEPITPEIAARAEEFVTKLLEKMGLSAEIQTNIENDELYINLTAEGSTIIGYHGEVLDSIEYLTNYVLNHETNKYYRTIVDCNSYRAKRRESLIAYANKMAAKCIKVRHKIAFEPMNSSERKIIHSALADNDKIITRSEGHEPNRRVVIFCKRR